MAYRQGGEEQIVNHDVPGQGAVPSDRIGSSQGWLDVISHAFAPAEIKPGGNGFSGRIRTFERDGLRVSRVSASGHLLERTPRHMSPHEQSQFVLCLQLSGQGMVIQDGRTATLGPGDATIYDTSRPYTLSHHGHFNAIGVVIPADSLSLRPRTMESLAALVMDSSDPVTSVVNGAIGSLEHGLAELPSLAQARVAHSIVELLETLCLHYATSTGTLRSDSPLSQLDPIMRYIDEHLADPELSPPMIAAAHFMSVRSLHTLVKAGGTSVAGWIRHRRLERCRCDLANPALLSLSVAAIGARSGLIHAPHFSNLFRSKYGVTPSAYRQASLSLTDATI
jgi:AraC-like DNA-binding protein